MMRYNLKICDEKIPALEQKVMEFWRIDKTFKRTIEERPVESQYVLYDGPPFATGLPHYGHILAHSLKDVFPRYHTMQGKRVERRFGWDCHGVPVEYEVEKELKLAGHIGIQDYGITKFNESCRSIVQRYTKEWRSVEERLGRFVDMDNDYKTMDLNFMESVWSVFDTLNRKGLVYEGKRVLAYSPELGTPLSDFESKLNFKTVADPEITMAFPLVNDPKTSLLVWTTTPWSVPVNVAIAINEKINYIKVKTKSGHSYIIAEDALKRIFKDEEVIIEKIPAKDLIGIRYTPMFDLLNNKQVTPTCFTVLPSDHVTGSDGTGLVHISPAFGEDDHKLGEKFKLPAHDFIDANGRFSWSFLKTIPGFEKLIGGSEDTVATQSADSKEIKLSAVSEKGLFFKDADKFLITYMKTKGRIFAQGTLHHEYPMCWRTDKPLMYRLIPSWYVKVTAIKDDLMANNEKVNWYPDFVGKKRFHSWLENARDWSISRNRYWGCPIPIWRNTKDPSDYIVVSSVAELEKLTGEKVTDLHRHFIDDLPIMKDGKTYVRISEVFDCWFESGAMPYAQAHYPFEAKEQFERAFPADFVAEGLDQTRGWFYTLMVLSTALFNKPAFKNCVVNGILLGNDGKKMSKSKKNYPKIDTVFEQYGADAMRLLLLGSRATQAQEMAVSDKGMEIAVKQILIPILHIYRFFAMQANRLEFSPRQNFDDLSNGLDQWLVFSTEEFRRKMTECYDKYNLVEACVNVHQYIENVSKFYIRNSKRRFKQEVGSDKDMIECLQCLHFALTTLSKCTAPLIPFMADTIYRELYGLEHSVHLERWPQPINVLKYAQVFNDVEVIRRIITLCSSSRDQQKIRLQQPLSTLYLSDSLKKRLLPYEFLLKEEINVEKIEWTSSSAKDILDYKISLNTKLLGPKYRGEINKIQQALAKAEFKLEGENLHIASNVLTKGEFEINYIPRKNICGSQEGDLWVALDTKLTPELREKGLVRELIHQIQMMRKDAKYDTFDKVDVYFTGKLRELVLKHEKFISKAIGSSTRIIVSESKDTKPEKFDITKRLLDDLDGEIQIKFRERKVQTRLRVLDEKSLEVTVVKPLLTQVGEVISSWQEKLSTLLKKGELSNEILVQLDVQFHAALQIAALSRKPVVATLSATATAPTLSPSTSLHQTFTMWNTGRSKLRGGFTLPNENELFYELNIPNHGSCLFYAIVIRALLPFVNDRVKFDELFVKLFGKDVAGAAEEVRSSLAKHDGNVNFINKNICSLEVLIEENLRKNLVEYMSLNKAKYSQHIPDNETFETRMKNMKEPKTWAGRAEIVAMSDYLNLPIMVYHMDYGRINFSMQTTSQEGAKPIRLLASPGANGDVNLHYRFLITAQDLQLIKPAVIPQGDYKRELQVRL